VHDACGVWVQVTHGCRWCVGTGGAWVQVVHGCKWCMDVSGEWVQVM
jgi:hypothetical protein